MNKVRTGQYVRPNKVGAGLLTVSADAVYRVNDVMSGAPGCATLIKLAGTGRWYSAEYFRAAKAPVARVSVDAVFAAPASWLGGKRS